jgi:Flp pilus assembly protein TadB
MNENKQTDEYDDAAFAERARELLDAEADNLNAPVQSRLNQARQAALDELPAEKQRSPGWWGLSWGPASAVTLALGLALTLWFFDLTLLEQETEQSVATIAAPLTPDDFDMLLDEASMEMLDELDFYAWLDAENDFDADTTG